MTSASEFRRATGFHPGFASLAYRVLYWFSRLFFRFEIRGADRVPSQTALWVGNHSAIGIADILCIVGAAHRELSDRPIVGMMHDLFIEAPILGRICRAFGAVPADRGSARDALGRGMDVLCYPGGNLDSCRPVHEHRRVVFGRRRGYVRLALSTGVPIVPFATIGSHYSYLLLPIGDVIARVIRLRRFSRDERLPIPAASLLVIAAIVLAALGWISGWWIAAALVALIVPNPVRITTEILPPIDVRALTAHLDDPEARVEEAHRLVHARLQAAVATMQHSE